MVNDERCKICGSVKDRAQNEQTKDHVDAIVIPAGPVNSIHLPRKTREQKDGVVSYPEPSLQTKPLPQIKAEVDYGGTRVIEESEEARIERLGRERPAKFKSFGAEFAFCYAVLASQFMCVCNESSHSI